MAVQAQRPPNVLLPDLRSRVRQSGAIESRSFISPSTTTALTTLDDLQLEPAAINLLRAYNLGLNFGQMNTGMHLNDPEEGGIACSLVGSRKRPRQSEDTLTRQRSFLPTMNLEKPEGGSPMMIPQPVGTISTGLRLSSNKNRINSSIPSTTGRGSLIPYSGVVVEEFNAQFTKQLEEIDQLIKMQGERIKQAFQEKSQRLSRTFLTVIEDGVLELLRAKESEIEKMNRRNLQLEERAKQLSMESQLWRNLARNNELVASNLRSSLEEVMAQAREQSREGCGESEVDDAESCVRGDGGDAGDQTFTENRELKDQRLCKVCRTNNMCILLLPCRHLCICKICENKLDKCPLCRSVKNASIQVYMS